MSQIINPNLPRPFKIEIDVNPQTGRAAMKPITQDPLIVLGILGEMIGQIAKMAFQEQSMIVGRGTDPTQKGGDDGKKDDNNS